MTALITGTSRGIGYAIAEKFLEKEHSVIGTSRKDERPFSDETYRHIACDLSVAESLDKLKKVFQGNDIPDVLINNAGTFQEIQFGSSDDNWLANWDETMQVNLRSAALLSKWALNAWQRSKLEGRIINIASRAGYRGDTGEYASYAASKGGMIAFTKSIARSFGKQGITAYTIAPGFVDTDMARGSVDVYGADYLTKDLALNSIAPPHEIAEISLLLATGKLKHATGQTIHVNSGSYMI